MKKEKIKEYALYVSMIILFGSIITVFAMNVYYGWDKALTIHDRVTLFWKPALGVIIGFIGVKLALRD